MALRISENQSFLNLTNNSRKAREEVVKYGEEVSSGYKAQTPSDSGSAGTISQFRDSLTRLEGYKTRAASAKAFLVFQEDIVNQANDAIVRAKELATQAANEMMDETRRASMAEEVFALRDHMVKLANSTYQGKYVWGGADSDDPPYDAATYVTPSTGGASQRYVFDSGSEHSLTRSVEVAEGVSVTVNTPGGGIFDTAIQGLERLGRALTGYTTNPATGAPDGTGSILTFPGQFAQQTREIAATIDVLEDARSNNIESERASLGSRQRRLETATSIIEVAKSSAQEVLSNLQDADITESATNLKKAQTALEASLTVTARVLQQSILDFL
jgi:flagellar hook-associated protein 3 FlgL